MKKFNGITCAALLLVSVNISAEDALPAEGALLAEGSSLAPAKVAVSSPSSAVTQELSAKLKAINTFSANFKQTLSDPSGEVLQDTHGKVSVKQPGLFYWRVAPPYEQVVVANRYNLWVYDPDLEQVTVSDRQKMDNSPAQILSGDFTSLEKQYAVSRASQKNGHSYTLNSLNAEAAAFSHLTFVFDTQGVLSAMTLTDKLEQVTDVRFSEAVVNTAIASELFNFIAPEGVDVITNE